MTDRTEETREEAGRTNGSPAAEETTGAAEEARLPEPLQAVADVIRGRYPDLQFRLKPDDWLEVNVGAQEAEQFFAFLKETPELAFDYLADVTAVDYEDDGFQVVYHLVAVGFQAENVQRKLVVKIDVPREDPRVPTAVPIWPTANFLEREVYDMMGVVFDGHPDLRRILMREDWVGHPLRKDYIDQRPPRPRVVKKT